MAKEFLYAVERQFPVHVSTLWSAWTKAEELEKWYFPTSLSSVRGATVSDLRLGGLWSCAVDVPEQQFVAYFFGKYLYIEIEKRIEHTLHYTQSKDEFEAKNFNTEFHFISLDFKDCGQDSWVRFAQFGELPEGEAEQAQAGMESYFDSLAKFLAE